MPIEYEKLPLSIHAYYWITPPPIPVSGLPVTPIPSRPL